VFSTSLFLASSGDSGDPEALQSHEPALLLFLVKHHGKTLVDGRNVMDAIRTAVIP